MLVMKDLENINLTQLNGNDLQNINGGVLPLLAYGAFYLTVAMAGYTIGKDVAENSK